MLGTRDDAGPLPYRSTRRMSQADATFDAIRMKSPSIDGPLLGEEALARQRSKDLHARDIEATAFPLETLGDRGSAILHDLSHRAASGELRVARICKSPSL